MFGFFKNKYEIFINELFFDCNYAIPFAVIVTEKIDQKTIQKNKLAIRKTIEDIKSMNGDLFDYVDGRDDKKAAAARYIILMASILSITNARSKNNKWDPLDFVFIRKYASQFWRDLHEDLPEFDRLYKDVFLKIHEASDNISSELIINWLDEINVNMAISDKAPDWVKDLDK